MQTPETNSPEHTKTISGLASSIVNLRATLSMQSPTQLAANTGIAYHETGQGTGQFELRLWGEPVTISFPELVTTNPQGAGLPLPIQALLLYHLSTSDGTLPTGNWVALMS